MTHPLLSFVIPLYNTEKYIDECLSSIINAYVDPSLYEVIVIDDGSNDSSPTIVKKYCSLYSNVFLFQQDNQGVSIARMNGVSHAKGDYIWFIDSDDYITEGATARAIKLIEERKGFEVYITPMFYFYEGEHKGHTSHYIKNDSIFIGKELLNRKDLFLVGPPQFIVHRNLFFDKWLFFPSETRFEDEYYSRILKYRSDKVLVLKDYMYCYRQWHGSHMNSLTMKDATDVITIYKYLDQFAFKIVSNKDIASFRYNIVSFLFEAYTRFLSLVGTSEFTSFWNNSHNYIYSEWKKYSQYFSLKEKILASILLHNPRLYLYFQTLRMRIGSHR